MRIPFLSLFIASPFAGLKEHAEKVKECAWAFQQAMECHVTDKCQAFEELRQEVIRLENEADAIKRRIRGHIPKGTVMHIDKFQLFMYLREQDAVLDSVQHALDWISYRLEPGIPKELEKEFFLLVDAIINPIEELSVMVDRAINYFKNFSDKNRDDVKEIIQNLRQQEHEADKAEDMIKRKAFNMDIDPITIYHTVKLSEIIGSIADHAENAGDVMRAMIAR
ncbi:MAG: TIGR00153 family protein [Desulfobacterales bacterium]|nr:TIGR00153 family protein [Desulfobacterales bacterium]